MGEVPERVPDSDALREVTNLVIKNSDAWKAKHGSDTIPGDEQERIIAGAYKELNVERRLTPGTERPYPPFKPKDK